MEQIESVFKTRLFLTDGPFEQEGLLDTISWRGKLWLVRRWRAGETEGYRQPMWLVRPLLASFERPTFPQWGENYVLIERVPNTILDGRVESGDTERFEVVADPPIETRLPTVQ
ncbi:MAG TPA: hypothetical protein VLJ17_24755 [Xanthobacteraceae bacterium]|nr:hypothetical protein [Xanthobacteraceae bacterium]